MTDGEAEATYGPGGRGFYGAVTVGARGQVALPAQARRDLQIAPGDKLLVLGDPQRGLALMSIDSLMEQLDASSPLLDVLRRGAGEPGRPD